MVFGVEAPGRRAAQNVLTEQSNLSHFALGMADSPVGAFPIIFYKHMLKPRTSKTRTRIAYVQPLLEKAITFTVKLLLYY